MIWIALGVLALCAIAWGVMWRGRGRSDAAGNALEHAYLVFAALILGLVALPVVIGWWLDSTLLMASPLLLMVVPLSLWLRRSLGSWWQVHRIRRASRMPTPALRDLELAVILGDAFAVEFALRAGVSLDDPDVAHGLIRTAIRSAGANEKLSLLLKAGADPHDGEALQAAMWHSDCLFTLFAHGVSPRAVLPSGDPVLFAALDQHALLLMEKLVAAGADPNQPDRDGWPLVVAFATGRRGYGVVWSFVVWLIDHGADPFQTGPDGRSLADLVRDPAVTQIDAESLTMLRARVAR